MTNRTEELAGVNAQVQRKAAKTSRAEYAIVGIAVFAVLMVIVYNYMQVATLTVQASGYKARLETLQSEENGLKAKQEQIFNLASVESKAKNELGMIKLDKSQVHYIEMANPEAVNIYEGEEELPAIVEAAVKQFNIVREYLR